MFSGGLKPLRLLVAPKLLLKPEVNLLLIAPLSSALPQRG